ncbi:MAG: TonB-dependent receptor [Hellea sp.]|nr:TonB-dependent receptor [Hellea sp.]
MRTGLLSSVFATSAVALSLTLAAPAVAQVTTSEIVGSVSDGSGAAISGATVTIQNTATGFSRTVTTDSSGNFNARNLSTSGRYNVSVTRSGFQGERVEDIALSLGAASVLAFNLDTLVGDDEIIVVAQRTVLADVAVGPSASFGIAELENAPAINRNIADIVRLDPRVYVDESRGDINAVQCVGQSSRFNSVTLDGVTMNDAFGLNANGYPTERMPFPFDALDQVSVEIAPFDVKYGGFTACNINSVTKSGTNEFHGGAFIDYTDQSLRGGEADDVSITFDPFEEIRYGVNVNGPIIKDKLFFNVAYEKLEGANTFSTAALREGFVTQAEVDQIAEIANRVYQYDPGFIPTSFDNEDEKILVKLDWNINNAHRAAFTYNYNDGFNITRSDGDSNELEFSNHFYERGAALNSYVGALYSDWSDNFSTEFRVGYLNLDNRQQSIGGNDFGEMQIRTANGGTVYIGGDDSRQSNKLAYDQWDVSARAFYDMGDHHFSFGAERKDLDIFNLFVQHTETEIRFDSIADFDNQLAQRIYYNNAPSHNPDDAAADWGYAINTVYGQDDFDLSDDLTLIAGLRYDWYTTSDLPTENPGFVADYGFSNSQNLDGKGLLQPRVGFKWDATDVVQLRGGVARYSGGNPNVWLSNNYSANNIDQVGALARAGRGAFSNVSAIDLSTLMYSGAEAGVPNSAGWAIPNVVYNDVSTGMGSNFELNYLDPDFKIPSDWKFSLGGSWAPDLSDSAEWLFQADVLVSKSKDTAIVKRGDLVATGTQTVNGVTVPTYSSPNMDSFVLTNSSVGNEAFVASLGASVKLDNGLDFTLGYAYSDAKDVQPMTSSVAFSNYNNRAYIDPQEEVLATSNYNIKHRITGSAKYSKDFWKNYDTNFFLFMTHTSGRPYSRVDDNPNNYYNFTPFLDGGGVLLPGTVRNEFTGPSWTKMDIKISQDLPGFRADDRAQVFVVIDNFTNFIDSDWGDLRSPSFPRALNSSQNPSLVADPSVFEVRFGASYDF